MNDPLQLLYMLAHGGVEAVEKANADRMNQGADWSLPLKDQQFAEFAAAGFTIGARVDDLLVTVTPPAGWTLERVDDDPRRRGIFAADGEQRGGVFLKDVPYDRKGSCSLYSEEYRRERAEERELERTLRAALPA